MTVRCRTCCEFTPNCSKRKSVAGCSALFKDAVSRHLAWVAFACGELDLADRDRNVMFIARMAASLAALL